MDTLSVHESVFERPSVFAMISNPPAPSSPWQGPSKSFPSYIYKDILSGLIHQWCVWRPCSGWCGQMTFQVGRAGHREDKRHGPRGGKIALMFWILRHSRRVRIFYAFGFSGYMNEKKIIIYGITNSLIEKQNRISLSLPHSWWVLFSWLGFAITHLILGQPDHRRQSMLSYRFYA